MSPAPPQTFGARLKALREAAGFTYGLVPLAAAAALEGDLAWVARIIGWRDSIAGRTGAVLIDPMMRELGERTEGRHGSIDRMLRDIDRARGTAPAGE